MHRTTSTFRISFVGILLIWGLLLAPQVRAQDQGVQIPQVGNASEGTLQETEPLTRSDVMSLARNTDLASASVESSLANLFPAGQRGLIFQNGSFNEAVLDQDGETNQALVSQGRRQGGGSNNTARITQSSRENFAVVVQQGQRNETNVSQGGGPNNIVGVRLQGTNNHTNVVQNGSGNRYLLDFTGNGLGANGPHTVNQIGSGNTLIQVGTGSKPFNVRQRGDHMAVRILHR